MENEERLKSKQKNATISNLKTFTESEDCNNSTKDISIQVPLLSKSKTCSFSLEEPAKIIEAEKKQVNKMI